jgi:quercetin dioxygenase-like cupin family protein
MRRSGVTRVHRSNDSVFVPRSGTFTGVVLSNARESGIPDVRVTSVLFEPGARTHWHRHVGGQILVVIAGAGILGTRDGEVVSLSPGDVVTTPPGTEHFHGATSGSPLLHEAISFGPTHWLEDVTEMPGEL